MTAKERRRAAIEASNNGGALGIAYARFSTQKQGSIAEQNAVNAEVAAAHGVRIEGDAWFEDAGVSRSLSDRDGLMAGFRYLEEHREVRFIVVNELERLTAGVAQRAKVVELCKRLGITILTEDIGAIDPFDEDKMLEADQRAVSGHGEVLKIRRRTRRSLKAKVRSGTVAMRPAFGTRMKPLLGANGEELPAGTRLVDSQGKKVSSGVLEVDEAELPWLRRMFEWADKDVSDDQIAARLAEAQVPTKNGRGGSAWRGNTVAGVLTNPLYKGEMTWGRTKTIRDADGRVRLVERDADDPERLTFPSPLGALIDPVLFERVQAKRAANAGRRRGRRRAYGPQLFDDLVYCARCGHKMYGRNDAAGSRDAHRDVVIWRYYCYSMRPGYLPLPGFGSVCKSVNSMQEKKILAALTLLTEAKPPTKLVKVRAVAAPDQNATRQLLNKQIVKLQAEHQRAVDLAVRGLLTAEELASAKETREAALADANAQLAMLDAGKRTESLTFNTERRELLAELVELLRDTALPVEDRSDALRRFGVRRVHVDGPRAHFEMIA